MRELCNEVSRCQNRDELERRFGKPLFNLSGKGFGPPEPDTIEFYTAKDCTIMIYFRDGKLSSLVGVVSTTAFDVAAGVLEVSPY